MNNYNLNKLKDADDYYIKISSLGYGKTFHELKRLRKLYEDSNKELKKTFNEILKDDLPPRYYMNLGCIEIIDFLLNKGR